MHVEAGTRATQASPPHIHSTPAPTVPPFLSHFSRRFLLHLTPIGRWLVLALHRLLPRSDPLQIFNIFLMLSRGKYDIVRLARTFI